MADPERIGRRGFLLAAGLAAAGLTGCAVQESGPDCAPTSRPRLPERNHLEEFFNSLGLRYDGAYFYDQEGNKFVFETFDRQERVEGSCPERIIIELKGEPCETETPTGTATTRVESPTATRRRPSDTPRPPSQTPVTPSITPEEPSDTPEIPTPTPPIPTPAPTNEDIIPTATQGS